jgi:DNA-directed RNA polymerase II subunit RPB1
MLDTLYVQHNRACVSKGDTTGIIAAQSMGEVVTQLCLNTFHSAGISAKNVTLGVPRFKELINVSKAIRSPVMTLPLKEEYDNLENIDFIAQELEYVNIEKLINRKYMSKDRFEFTKTYMSFEHIENMYPKSIVFHFDLEKLKRSGKTLYDIQLKIIKEYENVIPVYNHENDDPIMEIILVNTDEDIDDRYVFIFMNKLMNKMALGGDEEIKKTFVKKEERWVIETEGLNLDYVFNIKYFDHSRCVTNHVIYVYEMFGIEAARNVLLDEIKNVIEFDGSYVNRRHFYILVDTMTHKGDIMPITRHGINKASTGPLMKCSFEETMDILTDAGIYSELDNLNGVTENIIMGKLAPIGSGATDVMYKHDEHDDMNEDEFGEEFEPESPSSSEQYTDAYFDSETNYTDTWFDDGSECTETYFPIT